VRKAINENQTVQVVLVGVLVIVAAYLFMTRITGGSGSSGTTAGTTASPAPTSTTPAGSATTAATSATQSTSGASATTEPATGAEASGSNNGNGGAGASGGEGFVSGPGLPAQVADAYEAGKTVVLLVVNKHGIDDRKVEAEVRSRAGAGDTTLFVSEAKEIAKYSRIAEGVNVDRVPALVVIQPKRLTKGPLPEATVSYGYRGPESIAQAVRDAQYAGRENLPYYPH
jgi:hypothetical protein